MALGQDYEPNNAAYYYTQVKYKPSPSKFTEKIEKGEMILPNLEVTDYLKENQHILSLLEKATNQDSCFFHIKDDGDRMTAGYDFSLYHASAFLHLHVLNELAVANIDTSIKRVFQMTKIINHGQQQKKRVTMWEFSKELMILKISNLTQSIMENEQVASIQLQELLNILLKARRQYKGLEGWLKNSTNDQAKIFEETFKHGKGSLLNNFFEDSLEISDEQKTRLVEFYIERVNANFRIELNKLEIALKKYYKYNSSLDYNHYQIQFSAITSMKFSLKDIINLTGGESDYYLERSFMDDIAKMVASSLIYINSSMGVDVIERYYMTRAKWDIIIIALAIKQYEIKYKRWPLALNKPELKNLKFLNKDPWNSFRPYKIIKRDNNLFIYSLGPDRKNDKAKKHISKKLYETDPDLIGDIFVELNPFH